MEIYNEFHPSVRPNQSKQPAAPALKFNWSACLNDYSLCDLPLQYPVSTWQVFIKLRKLEKEVNCEMVYFMGPLVC